MKHSAVAVFRTLSEAERAVRTLLDHGFSKEQVSIISRHLEGDRLVHGFSSDTATVAGGLVGGIFGILLGSAFVWLPEFGPLIVMGSIAAEILGGFEGAVVGGAVAGALGWLTNLSISEAKIARYESLLKDGSILVVAHGDADTVDKAAEVLATCSADELDQHAPIV
jgi:hypothetical protein